LKIQNCKYHFFNINYKIPTLPFHNVRRILLTRTRGESEGENEGREEGKEGRWREGKEGRECPIALPSPRSDTGCVTDGSLLSASDQGLWFVLWLTRIFVGVLCIVYASRRRRVLKNGHLSIFSLAMLLEPSEIRRSCHSL